MNIYNLIKNQINVKELIKLTNEQKRETIDTINKLDNEGQQLLFIIINLHNKENNIEYQGQTINIKEKNSDIKFNLDNLCILLQHIIYKFTNMHYNKMIYDINRNIVQKI